MLLHTRVSPITQMVNYGGGHLCGQSDSANHLLAQEGSQHLESVFFSSPNPTLKQMIRTKSANYLFSHAWVM